ncbi:erythromycin esterase family protein [Thiomonas sp. FB-6]|uniref:erythromycin esterase family protein n=1 Tax=Thiomonas sp. FB-6 TaxID=1158291 RepID=UPI0003656131|nr:erythromycin esterase family protein [Thiomonas sp. FB-6]
MDHPDYARRRQNMVREQIASRGVDDERVLEALQQVAREAFVPESAREAAYEEVSLRLDDGRLLPQAHVLAVALAALELRAGEKVLEIGTGCGYGSAVLARLAAEVRTVEPDARMAERAASLFARLGLRELHVRHGEASAGWEEQGPYDAILVQPGVEASAQALRAQLRVGGRLVMAQPAAAAVVELVRTRRVSELRFESEDLADLRIAPAAGEAARDGAARRGADAAAGAQARLAAAVGRAGQAFEDLDAADLEPLLRRIGRARVVLIGEATHGTSEFYRMRQRITRALIEKRGFDFVAVEGDWPDCARIDQYVRHGEEPAARWKAFARFPSWMWRNREVAEFVDWLRGFNALQRPALRTAFHGLDLYSLYGSIERVLDYLERVDPATARLARQRYGCLSPWEDDPAGYARATLTAGYRSCEADVVAMLGELLHARASYGGYDGERFLDALQNARLVANAERYYRTMYYGSRESWNLRDGHMFETLRTLLDFRGPRSRAVVWAHNSHVGDSAATEMALRGEFNLGRLCRKAFGEQAYTIGFGTHAGQVAAAESWGGDMQVMDLRPSLAGSHERVFHDCGVPGLLLPMRELAPDPDLAGLRESRLQRAVGVLYRPRTEMASHYFESVLPEQYDEYIWIDRSHAVTALDSLSLEGQPDTYPFGV